MGPHWKCRCGAEGSGFLPEDCPKCGGSNFPQYELTELRMTEEGFREGLRTYYIIHNRGLRIANLLGFGCESIDFNGQESFEIRWESANCRCGCSGYSTHTEEIPTRYLWMKDEDILAEREEAKKKAEAAKLEEERKKKLAKAQFDLEAAQKRAASAQADAERALAKAAAELAALQENPTT